MNEYDQTVEPKILIGRCDLISRFSDFCLISWHCTYGSSNSNWYVKFQMFMSARAFWRVSYFAVFYKEYINFSWYNLIEAYIFSISI